MLTFILGAVVVYIVFRVAVFVICVSIAAFDYLLRG